MILDHKGNLVRRPKDPGWDSGVLAQLHGTPRRKARRPRETDLERRLRLGFSLLAAAESDDPPPRWDDSPTSDPA